MGAGTFILSLVFSLLSEVSFRLVPLLASVFLLLLVIFVGVFFDMVGLASVTAEPKVLHAKASQKVEGAKEAVEIMRNSARFASICNDVIGDVCGTLSGALGAAIIIEILRTEPNLNGLLMGVLMTSMVASLTVGGKAYAKEIAISQGTIIILFVGKILHKFKAYR